MGIDSRERARGNVLECHKRCVDFKRLSKRLSTRRTDEVVIEAVRMGQVATLEGIDSRTTCTCKKARNVL